MTRISSEDAVSISPSPAHPLPLDDFAKMDAAKMDAAKLNSLWMLPRDAECNQSHGQEFTHHWLLFLVTKGHYKGHHWWAQGSSLMGHQELHRLLFLVITDGPRGHQELHTFQLLCHCVHVFL